MVRSLSKGSSATTLPTAFPDWVNAAQLAQSQAMMQNAYNNAYSQAQMNAMHGASAYYHFQRSHQPPDPNPAAVPKTAASRVVRSDWEAEEDRKDADLNAWLSSISMEHLHVGTDE
jgi:hypothetical protein